MNSLKSNPILISFIFVSLCFSTYVFTQNLNIQTSRKDLMQILPDNNQQTCKKNVIKSTKENNIGEVLNHITAKEFGAKSDSILSHKISICSEVPISVSTIPGSIDYLKIIASFLSIIIAGIAIILGQGFYNRKKEYIRYLENKLNEFHRPISQALLTSSMLYDVLKEDKPDDFRALKDLIEKKKDAFNKTDMKIIKEIVEVGSEIEKIIEEHSGHILREETREQVGQLARHLRIFRMVVENNIDNYSEKFKKFTYPRNVNNLINEEYKCLSKLLDKKTKKVL